MKRLTLFVLLFFGGLVLQEAHAQTVLCKNGRNPVTGEPCTNVITTAVPFLRINPDARSGAMGDAGLATSPDANALHFNASKLAFVDNPISLSASYTPWLRAIGLNDVFLAYVTGYYNVDKLQTVGASLRYFSMGQIDFKNTEGEDLGSGKPREMEFKATYARKLSKNLAVAIGGKYIYSNLAAGQTVDGVDIKAGKVGAADISLTYRKPVKIGTGKSFFTFGTAFTNLGTKITYTNSAEKDFIPANMGVGTGLQMELDEYNKLGVYLDFNKLLVPSPNPDNENESAIAGVITSFSDAPGGFKEELKEINPSFGVEYWYNDQFALRLGYFNENKIKGNRKYFTTGLGLRYSVFALDISYLIPSGPVQTNPLANTLRFSISYLFENDVPEEVEK